MVYIALVTSSTIWQPMHSRSIRSPSETPPAAVRIWLLSVAALIVLMVVVIGGAGSISGSFAAALFLGLIDALFKYFVPEAGGFVIYGVLVLVLIFLPGGFARRRMA